MAESEAKSEPFLKDQGNKFFKSGNYLKAAALYTKDIKQDPSNPSLYSQVLTYMCIYSNTHVILYVRILYM